MVINNGYTKITVNNGQYMVIIWLMILNNMVYQ